MMVRYTEVSRKQQQLMVKRYRHMELSSQVHYCLPAIRSPWSQVSKLIVSPILGLMGMGMLLI